MGREGEMPNDSVNVQKQSEVPRDITGDQPATT